jgi:hypothetical protein
MFFQCARFRWWDADVGLVAANGRVRVGLRGPDQGRPCGSGSGPQARWGGGARRVGWDVVPVARPSVFGGDRRALDQRQRVRCTPWRVLHRPGPNQMTHCVIISVIETMPISRVVGAALIVGGLPGWLFHDQRLRRFHFERASLNASGWPSCGACSGFGATVPNPCRDAAHRIGSPAPTSLQTQSVQFPCHHHYLQRAAH